MANNVNIDGAVISPDMVKEICYLQDSDIAKMTIDSIDNILDYVLDTSPSASDTERISMVTTLHDYSKFIKTLTRPDPLNEKKETEAF